jgi:hypothetical protein
METCGMTTGRLFPFTWDGEVMIPRHPWTARKEFKVGETYTLTQYEERSQASHDHEFAWLHDQWLNLPENLSDLYPSELHLRKRALIEGGFYDETAVDAGSNAAAIRVAVAFQARDSFALVIVRGHVVLIRTAKSQSRRSMNKDEFQRSKTAIIEIVSGMTGTKPPEQIDPRTGEVTNG